MPSLVLRGHFQLHGPIQFLQSKNVLKNLGPCPDQGPGLVLAGTVGHRPTDRHANLSSSINRLLHNQYLNPTHFSALLTGSIFYHRSETSVRNRSFYLLHCALLSTTSQQTVDLRFLFPNLPEMGCSSLLTNRLRSPMKTKYHSQHVITFTTCSTSGLTESRCVFNFACWSGVSRSEFLEIHNAAI